MCCKGSTSVSRRSRPHSVSSLDADFSRNGYAILSAFKAHYNRAAGQRASGLFFKTNILPIFYLSI